MLIFYGEGLLAPCPTPKLDDHPLAICLQLLIQYICSYPPQLEAILSCATQGGPCCVN
jgi:hypothetical protein